uniref:Uncharacterized protein n=1 Tax=Cacopsylla melanoneura TaxID=428564 RepID=A0A8D8R3U4_9HEMI
MTKRHAEIGKYIVCTTGTVMDIPLGKKCIQCVLLINQIWGHKTGDLYYHSKIQNVSKKPLHKLQVCVEMGSLIQAPSSTEESGFFVHNKNVISYFLCVLFV